MDTPKESLINKFRDQVELFASFSNEEILTVLRISSQRLTLADGEIVFREGSPGNKMYVILAGAVRISRSLGTSGEEELAVLGQGQLFGEMGLIDSAPRSARATSLREGTILLEITENSMRELSGPVIYKFYRNFASLLARRLRAANDQTTRLAGSERLLTQQIKRLTATESSFRERLRGADLRDADLSNADLRRADLRGSIFVGSRFQNTQLRECSFRGADLQQSHFVDTDLRSCDFTGADLRGAVFRGTNLEESQFLSARIDKVEVISEIGEDAVSEEGEA